MSGRVVHMPTSLPAHACKAPTVHSWPEGTVWQCDYCDDRYVWRTTPGGTSPWWWRVKSIGAAAAKLAPTS